MDLRKGDCLELMKTLPDKSVDLMICDLPYGETNCKWDTCIDMEEFWKEFRRIRKSKRVACIHFCSTKFGYSLIKSWEKGFKMDMVWKKRNKTGGLQSRHRPMRNHEMIYFFYEQSPKYNRDKYHKRIAEQNVCGKKKRNEHGFNSEGQSNHGLNSFEPPNPASVVEEKTEADKDEFGWDKSVVKERGNKIGKMGGNFHPVQPASVVEENQVYSKKGWKYGNGMGSSEYYKIRKEKGEWEPPNPNSVVEEKTEEEKTCYGISKEDCKNSIDESVRYNGANFHPIQPASVLEENTIVEENTIMECKEFGTGKHYGYANGEPAGAKWEPVLPVSMFESEKVFIGKRHHQTEKPQDILEFFLKYWSDEGDTILDPTMGSGSTGVACKKLKRNFVGFELDEKIFKTAKERINNNN